MSLSLYVTRNSDGSEKAFGFSHERSAAIRIARYLWESYGSSKGTNHYALIANLDSQTHHDLPPADLILLTTNGMAVIDLKDCDKAIQGTDNTPWKIIGEDENVVGELKGGNSFLNPFKQVREYRGRLISLLKTFADGRTDTPVWLTAKTWYMQAGVVFTAGHIDLSNLIIRENTKRWFKVKFEEEVAQWAYELSFGGDSQLSQQEIDFIARKCFHTEPWVEALEIVQDKSPWGYLWALENGEHRWQMPLVDTRTVIGRSFFQGVSDRNYGDVSRQHATIEHLKGQTFINDLESRHGTWLNGHRLNENERSRLNSGDQIVFGGHKEGKISQGAAHFEFTSVSSEMQSTISITEFNVTTELQSQLIENKTASGSEDIASIVVESYSEAYHRAHGVYPGQQVQIVINPEDGRLQTYIGYLVVEDVKNPHQEIHLKAAQSVNSNAVLGDVQMLPANWQPDELISQPRESNGKPVESLLSSKTDETQAELALISGQIVPTSRLLGGKVLDGRYYLKPPPMSGGFGHVYRAHDKNLGRPVAVKVLRRGRLATELIEEAQQIARVRNAPHVVNVYDVNTTKDGVTYLAMEWVDGPALREWREENLAYEADFLTLARIAHDICDGLKVIHNHGIVHGDISPGNVLITRNASDKSWIPKLTDFGLAWPLTDGKPERWGGTPLYIAPEVLWGSSGIESDIYSLGAVLFFLFTGTHHLGDIAEIREKRLDELRELMQDRSPVRVSEIRNGVFNPRLDDIINRMLTRNSADRPTLDEIMTCFEEVLTRSSATDEIIQEDITIFLLAGARDKIIDKVRSANSEWLAHRLSDISDWDLNNKQKSFEVFEAIFGPTPTFDVFIYNDGTDKFGQPALKFHFAVHTDQSENLILLHTLNKVPIFYGSIAEDHQNLVIFGFHMVDVDRIVYTHNNAIRAKLKLTNSRGNYPVGLYERIQQMPRDTEPDADTEQRLSHWQGYMTVWERIAAEKEYQVFYDGYELAANQQECWFMLRPNQNIDWKRINASRDEELQLGELDNENAIFEFDSEDEDDPYRRIRIGELKTVDKKNHRLLITLSRKFQEKRIDSEEGTLSAASSGVLSYTSTGDRHNIRQQRGALEDLKLGKSVNPRLNRFIFDAQEAAVVEPNNWIRLQNDDLLTTCLNVEQRHAVEGALNAPDLYLIQGPPGTGKTTVIAELCYQFAQQGKRVLLSSQANLAVDNALTRLAHHPSILALRLGSENSIEDEGLQFVEQNIMDRWFRETAAEQVDYTERLQEQLKGFEFIAHGKAPYRYAKQLRSLEPEIELLRDDIGVHQNNLHEIENNIERQQQYLKDYYYLQDIIHSGWESWQNDMSLGMGMWRREEIDLLNVPTFIEYIEALKDAADLLRQYNYDISTAEKAHLNIIERDILVRVQSGEQIALLELQSPQNVLRLGEDYRMVLKTTADGAENLLKRVEAINGLPKLRQDLAEVEDIVNRPEQIQHVREFGEHLSQQTTVLYFARREKVLTAEREMLAERLGAFNENRSLLTAQQQDLEALVEQIATDLTAFEQQIQESAEVQRQANEQRCKQHEGEIERLQLLQNQLQNIVENAQLYVHFDNGRLHLSKDKLPMTVRQSLANQKLDAHNSQTRALKAIIDAIDERLKRGARNVGTAQLNQLREEWWRYLKERFRIIETTDGETLYALKAPESDVRVIVASVKNADAIQASILSRIQGFLKKQYQRHVLRNGAASLRNAAEGSRTVVQKQIIQHQQQIAALLESKKYLELDRKQQGLLIDTLLSRIPASLPDITHRFKRIKLGTEPYLVNRPIQERINKVIVDQRSTIQDGLANITPQLESMNTQWQTLERETEVVRQAQPLPAEEETIPNIQKLATTFGEIYGALFPKYTSTIEQLVNALEITDGLSSFIEDVLPAVLEEEIATVEQSYQAYISKNDTNRLLKALKDTIKKRQSILGDLADEFDAEAKFQDVEHFVAFLNERAQTTARVSAIIEHLNAETLFHNWWKFLDEQIALVENHIAELRQQGDELKIALADEQSQLEEYLSELEEWGDLWARALSSIPAHLYKSLPNINNPHLPDYIEEVMQIAKSKQWHSFLEQMRQRLPHVQALLSDWQIRLSSPEPGDKRSILSLYVKNANVIGTSCGQVQRLRYHDEVSSTFDVAIIDEVSKATPPELLLPMIRARKVILLGDHKQLPPMIGSNNTMQDLAEELGLPEEHLNHLKEPLFKHLYDSASPEIKIMLREQYRMLPVIRDAITIFYDRELRGGHERKHGLDMPDLFDSQTGLVWLDTPRNKEFAEESVGTSYRNKQEVAIIQQVLRQMNVAWQTQLDAGLADKPKPVGLITFYMPQYRLLRDLASDQRSFPALDLRVGTVDRFQGMERSVVIVSTVRNNSQGQIGFARAPERINVAFSRAQELLVIVGCQQMFTQAAGRSSEINQARQNYLHIAELIDRQPEGKRIRVPDDFTVY